MAPTAEPSAGSTPTRGRGPGRGDPHVLGRGRHAQLRYRCRHHLGGDPAGEWAETELKAARLVARPPAAAAPARRRHEGLARRTTLVEVDAARVSAFDHGLTVGDGVFETLKVVDGVPFALTRHLARLLAPRGAGAGGARTRRRPGCGGGGPRRQPDEPVGRLRITTRVVRTPRDRPGYGGPTVLVACSDRKPWPPSTVLATVPWVRNERSAVAGVKTTSYAENVVALAHAHARRLRGALPQHPGSGVRGHGQQRLRRHRRGDVTPPLSTGCLAGVTRDLVLEWCARVRRDRP